MMQLAFYFDQTRCTRCFTCAVACKDWNDVPAGPAKWRRVLIIEKGKYPNPFVAFLSTGCHHCEEPACVLACPTEAISKRQEDGIVVVDRESCLGKDECGKCLEACLYDSPQFGDEENAKMQKCDFCLERWTDGMKPSCVDGCPNRALDAGPINEMRQKYGEENEAVGLEYSEELKPMVVFKSKTLPTGGGDRG